MRIRKEKIEYREYQIKIFDRAKGKNLLVVLPTGLGKTVIALMLSEYRLNLFKNSKVLMLAPTRPLVLQHKDFFKEFAEGYFLEVTGKDKPEKREKIYKRAEVIFATPQTILNDLKNNRLNLENFSLIIFDEAHHATGNYAYVNIAKYYVNQSLYPRILALTATPGNSIEKIMEVCENLYIEDIEYRTEYSKDVRPYVKEKKIKFIKVELPEVYIRIKKYIEELEGKIVDELVNRYEIELEDPKNIKLKDLISLQSKLSEEKNFEAVIKVSALIKLFHLKHLITSQHPKLFENYIYELLEDSSNSSNLIVESDEFRKIVEISYNLPEHPKIDEIRKIILNNKDKTFLIFVQMRDTAKILKEKIKDIANVEIFAGQREMSQRKQQEIIRKFEAGFYKGLIATSVGEEGLHIPSVDLAIFYEPTPSVLRNIQRRGRVGRTKLGVIYILYSKNSPDEAYLWATWKKEKIC